MIQHTKCIEINLSSVFSARKNTENKINLVLVPNKDWNLNTVSRLHQLWMKRSISFFRMLSMRERNKVHFFTRDNYPALVIINIDNHYGEDIHEVCAALCIYLHDDKSNDNIFEMKDYVYDKILEQINLCLR